MKKLLVTLLMIGFYMSCATQRSSLEQNIQAHIHYQLLTGLSGNGVIIGQDDEGNLLLLSAAHLCNVDNILDLLEQAVEEGNGKQAIVALHVLDGIIRDKRACRPYVEFMEACECECPERLEAKPIAIDFERDLMLHLVKLPKGCKKPAVMGLQEELVPGTKAYFLTSPVGQQLVMFPDTIGLMSKTSCAGAGPEVREYVQTSAPMGPGTSGSPLYSTEDHTIIGILSCCAVQGMETVPTRHLLNVPVWKIREFIKEVSQYDGKSGRPYCRGEKFLCEVVRGETSVLEAFPRR